MGLGSTLKKLGPGLLFAGAAIGVSHLVMSTSAGAQYGFALVWAVVLINLMKYPFFEFGTRYTASTGETLIRGYKKLGKWAVGIIVALTIGSMFTIQAAVTIVTAGVLSTMFPETANISAITLSMIVLAVCILILTIGRYKLLDNLIKFIIILLSVCTIAALIMAINNPPDQTAEFLYKFNWDVAGITFLIALMGWMPAPMDLAIWGSIWTREKQKLTGTKDLKSSLLDFNIGYIGTGVLALCFLGVGALIIYGQGIQTPQKGGEFAALLIGMYTQAFEPLGLGPVANQVITIAAFTTMFSTTLTCLDAFPRVLSRLLLVLKPPKEKRGAETLYGLPQAQFNLLNYWGWIILVASGALVLLSFFGGHMGTMVKLATILAFVTTPLFAFINYRLITSKHTPKEAQPKLWLRALSWLGLIFLTGFSLYYMYSLFFI